MASSLTCVAVAIFAVVASVSYSEGFSKVRHRRDQSQPKIIKLSGDVARLLQQTGTLDYEWFIAKLDDMTLVLEQEKKFHKTHNYENDFGEFLNALKQHTKEFKHCRFVGYNFKYSDRDPELPHAGSVEKQRVILLKVCSDDHSDIKEKMRYSSAYSTVQREYPAKQRTREINEPSTLTYHWLLDFVTDKKNPIQH